MNFKAVVNAKSANPADQSMVVNLTMVPDGSPATSRPHTITLFIPASEESAWPLLATKTVTIS